MEALQPGYRKKSGQNVHGKQTGGPAAVVKTQTGKGPGTAKSSVLVEHPAEGSHFDVEAWVREHLQPTRTSTPARGSGEKFST